MNDFELNMYPSTSKILEAITDLINYYKWEFITVVYQEPSRIEDLIRLSYVKKLNRDFKYRVQFKLLSKHTSDWIDTIKSIKMSGSVHLIVDVENKLINKFLEIVNIALF